MPLSVSRYAVTCDHEGCHAKAKAAMLGELICLGWVLETGENGWVEIDARTYCREHRAGALEWLSCSSS